MQSLRMGAKSIFGAASIGPNTAFGDNRAVEELFSVLKKEGITTIDTARLYAGSEEAIGHAAGHEDFIIDTKIPGGFSPGTASRENILKAAPDSINRVQIKQFDILYLHAPDKTVPIEESLEAINEVYKTGIFKRFGLSNYLAEQVQEIYDITKSKGWVVPTVYQGNYNPFARKSEKLLFPTLRKLGFTFHAYSPLAGGFLTKTNQQLDEGAGRFGAKSRYSALYDRPGMREALAEWNGIAEKEGVSNAELAYRWVGYNSILDGRLGDAVIFGASSLKQAEQTAQALKKGPLSDEAVKRVQTVWEKIEDVAPLDNYSQ